jgi:peptide/nickel transport system permease protein
MDTSQQLSVAEEELEPILELTPALVEARRSQGRMILDRFLRNRAATFGILFIVFIFLFCFVGPLLWRIDPDAIPANLSAMNKMATPSLAHPFGTDGVGRDELARAMAGGRVSLLVALGSMLAAILLGVGIGSFAGYFGGITDNILMRLTDVVLAVPLYLLLFVLSASFTDGSPRSVIILIAIFGWTYAARLVRGEYLAHREREYVLAARAVGARDLRLMFLHILPNIAGPIIVNATLLIGNNIILESVMSYFNFGIWPPTSSWGNMVSDGRGHVLQAPWLVYSPALLIFLTVLSVNLVGDGLRDSLDPHMTER